MKTLISVFCLITVLSVIEINVSCKKEIPPAPKVCGVIWDKGRGEDGSWELTVDYKTVTIDSLTWSETKVNELYCQ